VLAERDPKDEAAMIRYGQNLGTAFQLIDDALDYVASPEELGKNLGDDLAEGKATLPVIYAMQKGSDAERKMIRTAIEDDAGANLDDIVGVIQSTGALQYTETRAQEAADVAIDAISSVPESEYKEAMIALAEFAVKRRS
jgi:octaprenyl-diphosphate synthase